MCNKFTSLWYENCAPTNKSPQVQTCFILVGNWWIWGAPWKPNFETHPYFTLKTVKLCWLSIPFQSFHLFRSFSTNDWATGFAQFAPGQKSVCGQDSGSSGILYDMLVYFLFHDVVRFIFTQDSPYETRRFENHQSSSIFCIFVTS